MWNPHFVILTLDFDYAGRPCGGRINNYLLEKSRVVGQLKMERNFHVFYQLCKGAEGKLRESCKIESCDQFRYLARSGCFIVWRMDGMSAVFPSAETKNATDSNIAARVGVGGGGVDASAAAP